MSNLTLYLHICVVCIHHSMSPSIYLYICISLSIYLSIYLSRLERKRRRVGSESDVEDPEYVPSKIFRPETG